MSEYTTPEKEILLKTAKQSIKHGLETGKESTLTITEYTKPLQQQRASFVTLEIQENLRGCIGSLQAYRSLITDVSANAFAAAFKDPRFTPLSTQEYNMINIHISILTPPEPMFFTSQDDLIKQLRPNIDGLILTEPTTGHRGTFLPAVWEQLSDPISFFLNLKNKAGLPVNYWSDTLKVERYTTYIISDQTHQNI